MPKILFLVDGLGVGGAERQMSLLLKYLSPEWETQVIALGSGAFHQVLLNQKTTVKVFQRQRRFDHIPIIKLYIEIIRHRPDIIHSWGGLSSALVAPICKVFRIVMIDGSIRIAGTNRHYLRRKITYALADHIVANSHAGLLGFQAPRKKSSVIYNALDPDRLATLNLKSIRHGESTKVVMTGRISAFKDFASFFTAARRLHAFEPGKWKFIAIGAGNDEARVNFEKQAEDLLANGVVELPRSVLEVFPYIQEADIGVLLSSACFKEGISNSIMEYMACGLPVICSDSGGNRELVINGETGFIIPPENVDLFIEKLKYLKDHPDISDAMGKAGYDRVISLCSIQRMVGEYKALYMRLLEKKHNNPLKI